MPMNVTFWTQRVLPIILLAFALASTNSALAITGYLWTVETNPLNAAENEIHQFGSAMTAVQFQCDVIKDNLEITTTSGNITCNKIVESCEFDGFSELGENSLWAWISYEGNTTCDSDQPGSVWEQALEGPFSGFTAVEGDPTFLVEGESGINENNTCNPVNVTTGNKFIAQLDYQGLGLFPLSVSRYYNSNDALAQDASWRISYTQRIIPRNDNTVTVVTEHGKSMIFSKGLDGAWTPNANNINYTLETVLVDDQVSQWLLTHTRHNIQEQYDATGMLEKVVQLTSGLTHTVTLSGNFLTVTHTSGQQIQMQFLNIVDLFKGDKEFYRIIGMTTPLGNYLYDWDENSASNARLISVAYPDETPGSFEDNPKRLYSYLNITNKLTAIIDERGEQIRTITYDLAGRVATSGLGDDGSVEGMQFQYDINSTTITDAAGLSTQYQYVGDENRPAYTAGGSNKRITAIEGEATPNCLATAKAKIYAADGRLNYRQDARGYWTETVYNDRGLLEKVRTGLSESNGIYTNTKDTQQVETLWHATLALPQTRTYSGVTDGTTLTPYRSEVQLYTPEGRISNIVHVDLTQITAPYPTNRRMRTWAYSYTYYDAEKRQIKSISIDGPRRDVSDIETINYNTAGLITARVNALGHTTTYEEYSPHGQPGRIIDANGVITTLTYNARGWLTESRVKHPSNSRNDATTTYDYYDNGLVERITQPRGDYLEFNYNSAKQLTSVTNTLGETIQYTPNALNTGWTLANTLNTDDTLVRRQQQTFDAKGRLLEIIGNNGQLTRYIRDENNNVVEIREADSNNNNNNDRITLQAFDALDRLTQQTRPDNTTIQYAYDAQGNLATVTDPRENITEYLYDGFGDQIQLNSPDTGETVYKYDSAGNMIERIDARNVVTQFVYDALNRQTAVIYPNAPAENITYIYDQPDTDFSLGRLTQVTDKSGVTDLNYDHRGNTVEDTRTIGGITYTTDYRYTLNDEISTITYPTGRVVSLGRDTHQQISSIAAIMAGSPEIIASAVSHQPFGPVYQFTAGNGLTTQKNRDLDYRITDINTTNNTNVFNMAFQYDAFNNVTDITRLDTTRNQSFIYDELDRLTQATGPFGTLDYSYDPNGNRTTLTANTGLAEAYTVDGTSNQLLENTVTGPQNNAITWAYDEVGNRIQESATNNNNNDALVYQYGDDNRLNQIARDGAAIGAYVHNAFGQRTQKTAIINNQLETIHFHYDLAGTLIAETDGTGALIRDYIYLDGAPIALIASDPAQPTGTFFYHTDHLGTPQMLTNGEQTTVWSADYNPFGEVDIVEEVVSNPLRFPGQYFDEETGHHYNYFRDYDPKTGRYIQSDPIGLGDGPNTYSYVRNNPIKLIDTTGLTAFPPVRVVRRGALARPPGQAVINAQVNSLIRQVRQYDTAFRYHTARPMGQRGRYNSNDIISLQSSLSNALSAGFCGPGASQTPNFLRNGRTTLNQIMSFIPNGTPNTWTPTQALPTGFNYQWRSNGVRFRVWGHGPNPNAPAGSFSHNNPTATLRVNNRTVTTTGTTVGNANSPTNRPLVHIPLDM